MTPPEVSYRWRYIAALTFLACFGLVMHLLLYSQIQEHSLTGSFNYTALKRTGWGFLTVTVVLLAVLEFYVFSPMSRRIRRDREELERHRAHLEQLVEERTRQLEETNRELKNQMTLRRQEEEKVQRQKEQDLLHREMVRVAEREQRRIGRELHDGLGQQLTGIALLSQALAGHLKEKGVPEAGEALQIARFANNAVKEAGRLSRGLSPISLETHGLIAALEDLAAFTQKASGASCRFRYRPTCTPPCPPPSDPLATHLFRIAQEAVTNAINHGQAREILLTFEQKKDHVTLKVTDDGAGLPRHADKKGGMGIRTMRYRASLMGGDFGIRPRRNGGTEVTVHFPVKECASIGRNGFGPAGQAEVA